MQRIDRWRNWTPASEKFSEFPGSELTELTKPTLVATSVSFVSPVLGQVQNVCDASPVPPDDSTAWRKPFGRWLTAECGFRDHCRGAVEFLHKSHTDWCERENEASCTDATFERLLTEKGFSIADGMVYGLLLRVDLEAAFGPQERWLPIEWPEAGR